MLDLSLLTVCFTGERWDGATVHPGEDLIAAARRGNLQTVKSLLAFNKTGDPLLHQQMQCSPTLNYKNHNGESPLYVATRYGHKEVVEYLLSLQKVIAVDLADAAGETALFKATRNRRLDMVELLLNHGANSNICNQWGDTCLLIASEYGYDTIVECLLRHGADCEHFNRLGESAFFLAQRCGYIDIVRLLESHYEYEYPMMTVQQQVDVYTNDPTQRMTNSNHNREENPMSNTNNEPTEC